MPKICFLFEKAKEIDQLLESDLNLLEDDEKCALVATVQNDPNSYREAMSTENKFEWEKAVKAELESMEKNKVWTIIDRPSSSEGEKPNIIDSRWVLKRKVGPNNEEKYKA